MRPGFLLLALASVCAPALAQRAEPAPPAFTLVVARAVSQSDPRPASCGPDGSCDDNLFLGLFDQGRTIAGAPLPRRFHARMLLHTPLISPTTLAMIVERLPDGSLVARRITGFHYLTHKACFDDAREYPVAWQPTGPGITIDKGVVCYRQP